MTKIIECNNIWFLQFRVKGRVLVRDLSAGGRHKFLFFHPFLLLLYIHQFKKVHELKGRSPATIS